MSGGDRTPEVGEISGKAELTEEFVGGTRHDRMNQRSSETGSLDQNDQHLVQTAGLSRILGQLPRRGAFDKSVGCGDQLPNGIEQDIRYDADYLRKTFAG
jgi:hypothetical protein